MTAVNRTTLYGFFQTGDLPTQAQFQDLIDSSLNLAETSAQSIISDVTVSGALISKTFVGIGTSASSTNGSMDISYGAGVNTGGGYTSTITLGANQLSFTKSANQTKSAYISSPTYAMGGGPPAYNVGNFELLNDSSNNTLNIGTASTGYRALTRVSMYAGASTTTNGGTEYVRLVPSVLSPGTNDGTALGSTSLSWSDLFLASGGVINWNNGTYTITQSSSDLAFSGSISASGNILTLGSLTPSQTGGIVGTTTNNNANSGSVGQLLETETSASVAVSMTSVSASTVCVLPLGPGDYDVWATVGYATSAGTSTSVMAASISTAIGALTGPPNGGAYAGYDITQGAGQSAVFPVGQRRLRIATSTNACLVTQCTFSGGAKSAYGYIAARRRR